MPKFVGRTPDGRKTDFKKEPITIQGTFGYGLKEIVSALYKHHLIDDIWTDDMNGLDAMATILHISEEADKFIFDMVKCSVQNRSLV